MAMVACRTRADSVCGWGVGLWDGGPYHGPYELIAGCAVLSWISESTQLGGGCVVLLTVDLRCCRVMVRGDIETFGSPESIAMV